MKRPPGRPPLDAHDRSVQFCVTVPGRQYAQLCSRARKADVSVAEIVRRDLEKKSKYRVPRETERNM